MEEGVIKDDDVTTKAEFLGLREDNTTKAEFLGLREDNTTKAEFLGLRENNTTKAEFLGLREDNTTKAEFLGLREDNTPKADFQGSDLATFWHKAGTGYPVLSDRALKVLIPFAQHITVRLAFQQWSR